MPSTHPHPAASPLPRELPVAGRPVETGTRKPGVQRPIASPANLLPRRDTGCQGATSLSLAAFFTRAWGGVCAGKHQPASLRDGSVFAPGVQIPVKFRLTAIRLNGTRTAIRCAVSRKRPILFALKRQVKLLISSVRLHAQQHEAGERACGPLKASIRSTK